SYQVSPVQITARLAAMPLAGAERDLAPAPFH
ncbi:MAG: hypothetical protein QOD76_1238, partial [Solirubrobacteraceae bacterium]|nr:hypothetical protein [Solirubrobacteraceae bacterium]